MSPFGYLYIVSDHIKMRFSKSTIVFVAFILPVGFLLALYAAEVSQIMSQALGMDVSRQTVGVTYLFGTILVLKIVSIYDRKSKK